MRLVATLPILLFAACGTEGPLPVARIDSSPKTLCEGDDSQRVTVSGKRSTGSDGTRDRLAYAWSFSTPPLEILQGGLRQESLVVRFGARHAVRIGLTVHEEGLKAASRETLLSLTRMSLVGCDSGCAAHETCVTLDGSPVCVDDLTCAGDDECGCLECRPDDAGVPRCVP